MNKSLSEWEAQWSAAVMERGGDAAHDYDHVARVVATAKEIAAEDGGRVEVVVPAAWLHDLVSLAKNDPERHLASRKSAAAACDLLRETGYPSHLLPEVAHCIEAHSFSAGIEPRTLEACIVQDADRLDALGAIGIARCFATAGVINRVLYHPADPFAENRPLNDQLYTLDHFGVKLLTIAETLRTTTGKKIGERRVAFMREFLRQMRAEIGGDARS